MFMFKGRLCPWNITRPECQNVHESVRNRVTKSGVRTNLSG